MLSPNASSSKSASQQYFRKHKCCCNLVHVKRGAQIIAVIQSICAIFSLIIFVFSDKLDDFWGALKILSILGEIIVLTILFVGMKKENPHLLLPYLLYESLMVLVALGFILSGIFAFIFPNGSIGHVYTQVIDLSVETNPEYKISKETAVKLVAAFTILMFANEAIVYLWFIHVVFKYYNYLRDLNQVYENNNIVFVA